PACDNLKDVKARVNLDKILMLRSSNNLIYYDFIEFFLSAVVGKKKYKAKTCHYLLSSYASVSDEAFAILVLENNIDTWLDMAKRKITKGSNVPRKFTNGGSSKGEVASCQHNKGWLKQGLDRFNELFDLVQKNR